VHQGDSRITLR
jgi:hypothetical protein